MLKNMKIGKRLIAAFLVAILISSVAGILGIALLTKSNSDHNAVLSNYGFAQGELGNLGRHFQASRVLNLYIVTSPNKTVRDGYLAELVTEDANVDKYMLQVKARLGSELGQKTYATLSTAMEQFRAARQDTFTQVGLSTDASKNVTTYRRIMADSSEVVRATIDTMIEDKSRIEQEKALGLSQQVGLFQLIMVGVIVGAFIVAAVLATTIARGISRPLSQLELAAAKMAKGDFDVEISHKTRDEIGSLAQSMREMTAVTKGIIQDTARGLREIENGNFDISPQVEYIGVFGGIKNAMVGIITGLSHTISQIGQASDQVSSGSEQVSSGAQALSQGATEQASSIEELAATINEVSGRVKTNAENAAHARTQMADVSGQLEYSNTQMQELTRAMGEISTKSIEIGKIIKTIDDIAFQTNILALNAAVEAARAGAAGKGFAVVADEVRNLASKSAEAAKNTTALIEGSIRAVENGTHIAEQTAKSLIEVVAGAQGIMRSVDGVTVASQEQAESLVQVTQGVDQISAVVQTNSATAEESAAASQELSGQAAMLETLMKQFKIKGGTSSTEAAPPAREPARAKTVSSDGKY